MASKFHAPLDNFGGSWLGVSKDGYFPHPYDGNPRNDVAGNGPAIGVCPEGRYLSDPPGGWTAGGDHRRRNRVPQAQPRS